MSEGRKYDSEKPKLHLLPPKAVIEVGKVLTFGAAKYDPENWKKVPDLQNRYTSAALRHIFAHMDGEELDPETKLSHLAHAMCCLLFKLEVELEDGSIEKERPREADFPEYPTRNRFAESDFFGPKAYNKEGGLFDIKYNLQYEPPKYDFGGISNSESIHGEEEKSK